MRGFCSTSTTHWVVAAPFALVGVLGLAFKPDTDDMREASSLVLASRLEGEAALVCGDDPVAGDVASLIWTSCRTIGMSSMYHQAKRPAVVAVARGIASATTSRSSWTMRRPSWKSTCMCVLSMRAATARTAW